MIQGNENCEIWYTDVLRLVLFVPDSKLRASGCCPFAGLQGKSSPKPKQRSLERLTVSFGFSIFQLMTSSQN